MKAPTHLPEYAGRIRRLQGDPEYLPLSVTLEDIDAERASGWHNYHPEFYCHRCGCRNLTWWTDPETWNPVMRPAGVDTRWHWNEIICMPCFTELADLRAGRSLSWRIVRDGRGCSVQLLLVGDRS